MKTHTLGMALLMLMLNSAYAAGESSSPPDASAQPNFTQNDVDGDGRLSSEELQDWDQQAFDDADTDGDGSLSEEEYGRAVATTGDEVASSLPSEETVGVADEGAATPVPARDTRGREAEPLEE